MITRTDKLVSVTINTLSQTADVVVTEEFSDSIDGANVATSRGLTDSQASAAYNAQATQTFLAAALAYVNSTRAQGAPQVTLP
jgi:hypothetical protein